MAAKYTIAVFGLITNEQDEILLGKDQDHKRWVLPGGRLELGEDLHQALVREIKEETGLEIEPGCLVGIYSRLEKQDIAFVFKCRVLSGELVMGLEMSELNYFSENNLPRALQPKILQRLKNYWHPPEGVPVVRQ